MLWAGGGGSFIFSSHLPERIGVDELILIMGTLVVDAGFIAF